MAQEVDPTRSMFISYRQSDGAPIVYRLARLLRAAGVPVWRDADDLPPGDTDARLREVLASGLAGAILVVTKDIAKSTVVRNLELYQLLQLEQDPQFMLAIANAANGDGPLDYAAPDLLLERPPGTLERINQMPIATDDDLREIVKVTLRHRMDRYRELGRGASSPLHIDIRTRSIPHSADFTTDLPIRLTPAVSGRLPSFEALHDLQLALPTLPHTVERTNATSLIVTGSAHLSIAFALGCALPTTFMNDVVVQGSDGSQWRGAHVASSGEDLTQIRVGGHKTWPPTNSERAVLAFVDLVPVRSDEAYGALLRESAGKFQETIHIELLRREPIDPANAAVLSAELAGVVRALSRRHQNAELHLALHTPFPLAVHLGRLLNTFRTVVYEWDDSSPDGRSQYVPVLAVAPTNGTSLVTALHTQPQQIQNPIRRMLHNARTRLSVRQGR